MTEYRILIVDDERSTLDLLREEFEFYDVVVDVLQVDENTQVRELSLSSYDAFLLDVMLVPGRNGFDIADSIQEGLGRRAPVVLMSQSAEDFEDEAQSRAMPIVMKTTLLNEGGVEQMVREFLTLSPVRCVVCDDSSEARAIVEEELAELGLYVRGARTVEDAIDKVKSGEYHLALVDIFWKRDSGHEPAGIEIMDAAAETTRGVALVAFSQYRAEMKPSLSSSVGRLSTMFVDKSVVMSQGMGGVIRRLFPVIGI